MPPPLDGLRHFTYFNPNRMVYVPHWLAVVAFALLPAMWLLLRLARPRGSGQDCIACGYNLTGNTSGVCPECGKSIE